MKEIPLIFSGPMVRAILDGTKSMTRRIVKPSRGYSGIGSYTSDGEAFELVNADKDGDPGPDISCPYSAGDRIWVRETFLEDPPRDGTWADVQYFGCPEDSQLSDIPERFRRPVHCIHRASWTGGELVWRSPIHMPRWASRLTLEVTGVRVERLHSISEDDAQAEGWIKRPEISNDPEVHRDAARDWIRDAWHKLNGKKAPWASNCWVWVIAFRRIQ